MQSTKPLNPKPEMRRFVRRPPNPTVSIPQQDVSLAPHSVRGARAVHSPDTGSLRSAVLEGFKRRSDVSASLDEPYAARAAGQSPRSALEREAPDDSANPVATAQRFPASQSAPLDRPPPHNSTTLPVRFGISAAEPHSSSPRLTTHSNGETCAQDTVSPAYGSQAHLCIRQPSAEHTLLVYRMGSVRYLKRCVEEGLVMDFSSTPADPLDSDPKALEPYRAPWHFYHSPSDTKQPTDCVPLPPLAIGEVPLTGESTRGSVVSSSRHLVISGCRAYHTRIPAPKHESSQRYITQYAIPMFVLDLMERGSTGYNTFYHRAECPCNTGFSIMALQMSPSSIVTTSSSAVSCPAEPDDYTAASLGADSFTEVTIVGMPYMAPYFYVEGALCKDGTCISRLGVSDYRPDSVCGPLSAYPPMVPRLKVMCVLED